jgi:hypothetical protein
MQRRRQRESIARLLGHGRHGRPLLVLRLLHVLRKGGHVQPGDTVKLELLLVRWRKVRVGLRARRRVLGMLELRGMRGEWRPIRWLRVIHSEGPYVGMDAAEAGDESSECNSSVLVRGAARVPSLHQFTRAGIWS